jgi:hypothetical protein
LTFLSKDAFHLLKCMNLFLMKTFKYSLTWHSELQSASEVALPN